MKKGFTLIELLAIIAILTIIFVIVSVEISKAMTTRKEKLYEQVTETIENAAKIYVSDNYSDGVEIPQYVTLGDLISANLLETPLINPKDGVEFGSDTLIIIAADSDGVQTYSYEDNGVLPVVSTATIVSNNSINNKYAKNGSVITLSIEFNKSISNTPTVQIGGRVATVTGSGTTRTATYTIPSNEASLAEGTLDISISNYTDVFGISGSTLNTITSGGNVTYDRTSPVYISFYIGGAGNPTYMNNLNTVLISSVTGAAQMCVNVTTNCSSWISYAASNPYSLSSGDGSKTLYVWYRDLAGNEIGYYNDTIVLDTTAPTITMSGSSPITITVGSTYTDSGATATDAIAGNLTSSIQTVNSVNANVVGAYTVTYNVMDPAGNSATQVTRTVNVENSALSDYIASEGVNKPRLATGMTAIKWNTGTLTWDTVSSPNTDTTWYDYSNKQWANAKTTDGSFWVWIPRYAYKIATNYHTSNTGTTNIKFLIDNTNTTSDSTSIATTPTYSGSSQTNFIVHPAFNFGGTQITGIWVAKFEASGTTSAVDIKPNVTSLRSITIDSMFTASRNMETNSRYGWGTSGTGIDTHLIKNIEWGAVAYLFNSSYGLSGTNMWVNAANTYTTGCAGDTTDSAETIGCLRTYDTTNGGNASTTGNIYGIYDMRGGAHEYTAAYLNNGTANLTTYGASLVSASSKYKDVYPVGGTDDLLTNYAQSVNIIGDGIWETSEPDTSAAYGWYGGIWISYPYLTNPFFRRGGLYSYLDNGGIYAIEAKTGASSSSYTFRPVLIVDSSQ